MEHGFRNLNLYSDIPRILNLSSCGVTVSKVLVQKNLVNARVDRDDALAHVDCGIHWINVYLVMVQLPFFTT